MLYTIFWEHGFHKLIHDAYLKEFDFLLPINLRNKIRLGNLYDGGYVVYLPALYKTDILITYGIGWDVAFEVDFYELTGKKVWLYDPSMFVDNALNSNKYIDNIKSWKKKADYLRKHNIIFINEGISVVQKPKYNTFEYHLKYNNIVDDNILLKIDIEGDEYEVFTDDCFCENLHIVNQIVIEFHDLNNKLSTLKNIIRRLKKKFEIIHIHGNNNSPVFTHYCADTEIVFPEVLEITFLKKEYIYAVDVIADPVLYPIVGLDYPNNPEREEYILNMIFQHVSK